MGGIVGAAISTSTATSRAAAIDAGAGANAVTNTGALHAIATSTAVPVNVSVSGGVALSINDVWDEGAEASATANGIAVRDGSDTIDNRGAITASATATVPSVNVAISGAIGAAIATANSSAQARAIDAAGGDDTINNSAHLSATADTTAVAVNVAQGGLAVAVNDVWDGGVEATASAIGIDAGVGDDEVANDALIETSATARAPAIGVAVSYLPNVGAAAVISTATSDAEAIALQLDSGDDTVVNRGELRNTATAGATAVNAAATLVGAAASADAFWDGGTAATARARGIDGGAGVDTIDNSGTIEATATATTNSANVALSGAGISGAIAASTATAESVAVTGGGDDDVITNSGELTAIATATSNGLGVAATLGGAAAADTSSTAIATAVGIDGGPGAGVDTIDNTGDINASATATARGGNVAFAAGVALNNPLFDGSVRAEATAVGLGGGDGLNVIVNHAAISLDATARNVAVDGTLGLVAFAGQPADASSSALARATGIVGGADADTLDHRGTITAHVLAEAPVRGLSGNVAGVTNADFSATGAATAIGLDGRAGNDTIDSSGAITLAATARAPAQGRSVTIAGAANQNTSATALATTTGITGGAGLDEISHTGLMDATAHAEAIVAGFAWTLAGSASQAGLATGTARASGVAGDDNADTLHNSGTIDIAAAALLQTTGNSTAIVSLGGTTADVTVAGDVAATGIAGGEAGDALENSGAVTVAATTTAQATGSSWTLGGAGSAQAGITSATTATGLDGGDGEDVITNTGTIDVAAAANSTATNASWTFAGRSSDAGRLVSTATAAGVAGGEGADTIVNDGAANVAVTSTLNVTGSAKTTFGGASSGAAIAAESIATGLDGGEGDDAITNRAVIAVNATSTLTTSGLANTFAGGATGGASVAATSDATGISGDSGADDVRNETAIEVRAATTLTSSVGTNSILGGAVAAAQVNGSGRATGIDSGANADAVVNRGGISATVALQLSSSSAATAGGLFADGITRARSDGTALAHGIDLGAGANTLLNEGALVIVTAPASGNQVTASAASTGVGLVSPRVVAESEALARLTSSRAVGLTAGDDLNDIDNVGALTVRASDGVRATSSADGSGLSQGDGTATANAEILALAASGIAVGHGGNAIANRGDLTITATPRVSASATSDADGLDFFNAPRSEANVRSTADNVTALGIATGDGDSQVTNSGSLAVTAAPVAGTANASALFRSRNDSQGRSLAVDSFATAYASASNAQAIGIAAGDGANEIENSGAITASSRPTATASAVSRGVGFDGDAESYATALATDATAVGIRAGHGGNSIINSGSITVSAIPAATATADAAPGSAAVTTAITVFVDEWLPRRGLLGLIVGWVKQRVEKVINVVGAPVLGQAVESAQTDRSGALAIGIQTGSGDDHITNQGTITTSLAGGATGVGIDAGAGADTVTLGDGSSVIGRVDLGADDDTLRLSGTSSVTGGVQGGSGTNTVVFDGPGSFADPLTAFSIAIKQGAGVFTVPALPGMQRLEMQAGTLHLGSSYTFAPGGMFQATINGDGTHGRLHVAGTATLDGDLVVLRGPGAFATGMIFPIITAEAIGGKFVHEALPLHDELVRFELQKTATAVNVVTDVAMFATLVPLPVESARHFSGNDVAPAPAAAVHETETAASVAAYLDAILPTATGDVSSVLGAIQELPRADARAALMALTPLHLDFRRATTASLRRQTAGVHARLATVRADGGPRDSSGQPVFLAASGRAQAPADALGLPLQAWGGGAAVGLDYQAYGATAGVDRTFGDRLTVGLAFGSDLRAPPRGAAYGDGGDSTLSTAVYGTWLPTARTYVESVLLFAQNEHGRQRRLDVGRIQRLASSNHDSRAFSLALEAGRTFAFGGWQSESYAAFSGVAMREPGFRESGADDVDLVVDERSAAMFTTELGWRVSRWVETSRRTIRPRLDLAWLRDFDVGPPTFSARFAGVRDGGFRSSTADLSGDGLRVGLGMDFLSEGQATWGLGLGGEFRSGYTDVSGSVQVRF